MHRRHQFAAIQDWVWVSPNKRHFVLFSARSPGSTTSHCRLSLDLVGGLPIHESTQELISAVVGFSTNMTSNSRIICTISMILLLVQYQIVLQQILSFRGSPGIARSIAC